MCADLVFVGPEYVRLPSTQRLSQLLSRSLDVEILVAK